MLFRSFVRLEQRARELAALARAFEAEAAEGHVRWIDLSPHQARLVESPLDIRELFTQQRQLQPRAWVFTSATLGDDDRLSWFTGAAGLEDARALRVGSPFDYAAHARLWVPARFPKPNEAGHPAAVGRLAARLAGALGGRTFVLTTTLRVLPAIAQALRERAVRNHRSLQGELMAVLTEAARRSYGSGLEPLVTRNPITVEEAVKRVKGLFPGGTESSVEFIRRDRDERAGEC